MSGNYQAAGKLLREMMNRRVGLKTLMFNSDKRSVLFNNRLVFALVCQAIKYHDIIARLIADTPLYGLAREPSGKYTIIVMVYDLLFGKGCIIGGGSLRRSIMENSAVLKEKVLAEKTKLHITENEHLLPGHYRHSQTLLKYARVNTLKMNLDDAISSMATLKDVKSSKQCSVDIDSDIPSLLRLPSHYDLHDNELVTNGSIILQDKASCMPVHVLLDSPQQIHHVIDACAAPGNKTTQLAAGLVDKVHAFERDSKRFKLLCSRVERAGAGHIITPVHADFRTSSPTDPVYEDVDAIVVDPSCSGSGLAQHRIEASLQLASTTKSDLYRLQRQQVELIMHAMKFPGVRRITYSTCSVNREENEDVVRIILRRSPGWKLDNAMPSWPCRGWSSVFPGAEHCIRSSPEMGTHGFFVALFVRVPVDQTAPADLLPMSTKLSPSPIDEKRAPIRSQSGSRIKANQSIQNRRRGKRCLLNPSKFLS